MYLKEILSLNSSIIWCENKNTHSIYISEFWNALTGIALCIISIIIFYENKKSGHDKLFFTSYLLFLVGIGTILFHATLLYVFQLLDELPMLLIAIGYYNILLKLNLFKKIFAINLNLSISYVHFCYISMIIIGSYFYKPQLQIIFFQGSLAIIIGIIFFIMYMINNNLNIIFYNNNIEDEKSVDARKNYFTLKYNLRNYNKIGVYIFTFSLFIWNIENMYCFYTESLQLHAWWHIFTSIGMYYLNMIIKTIIELDKIS